MRDKSESRQCHTLTSTAFKEVCLSTVPFREIEGPLSIRRGSL